MDKVGGRLGFGLDGVARTETLAGCFVKINNLVCGSHIAALKRMWVTTQYL